MDAAHADYLLQLCRSEVKRIGGQKPSLTHLAIILRARSPEAFGQAFNEQDRSAVDALVATRTWVLGDAEIVSLLEHHHDEASIAHELRTILQPWLQAAVEGASPAEDSEVSSGAQVAPVVHLIARDDACRSIIQGLSLRWPRPVIVVAPPGSGRTSLAAKVAQLLSDTMDVTIAGYAELSWQPEQGFKQVLRDASNQVIWLDDFDHAARLGSDRPNMAFIEQVSVAASSGQRLVLVVGPRLISGLGSIDAVLVDSAVVVELSMLNDADLRQIVAAEVAQLEDLHGVNFDDAAIVRALFPVKRGAPRAHPGVALGRLDHAGARAKAAGLTTVDADLVDVGARDSVPTDVASLTASLARRIKGQDAAITAVAKRLALTSARLDLRPERPDGVLLFVGPTGVGKTELARALADELFGDSSLIRLDMSEYSHDWAVSRIVGPMPGYVGSTEPEGWLTTRIAKAPRSVVLLDEIEKAHPSVWNIFLQAFDVGRLTDSKGRTVDLSTVVFVMTSNLGVAESQKSAIGFGSTAGGEQLRARIMTAVKDRMPPELLNRMDDVVVFEAMRPESIREIAEMELGALSARLESHGRHVEMDVAPLAALLASTGYDPAYGARHLHRNIERMLLGAIAEAPSGAKLRVGVTDERVCVSSQPVEEDISRASGRRPTRP